MASAIARKLSSELESPRTKMGDIKKRAKEITKDHQLALELWATGAYHARLLATLVFDKKLLTQEVLEQLATDMLAHEDDERAQLADWLLANQLMKSKPTTALLESWERHESPILRPLFWYHQARLRWTGQTPPDNTTELVEKLEAGLADEHADVQWAMNFCAGWIGVHETKYRTRCVKLGKAVGLYEGDSVPKNCTPSYLPEFIRIEAAKRE